MLKILSERPLPDIPWQERPADCAGPLWRFSGNPVLERNPIACAPRIYNSAVVPFEGSFIGVFRADHRDFMPHLHLGRSRDGFHWQIDPGTIDFRNAAGDPVPENYSYDPRVVLIEDTYYISWCTDFHGPTIGLASTKDFCSFTRLENAFLPFNRNGVLFPRRVNGSYLLLSRPSDQGHTPFGDIFLSQSPDLCHWGRHRHVMAADGGWWEDSKIGAGPAPIETELGWLLLYHGVANTCNGLVYSVGGAILDRDDPSRVLWRCNEYLLTPETIYETVGLVPNVLFPCAALCDSESGRLALYYGAADTVTALAFGRVDEIVEYIRSHAR
ncbi:glycoside hydrolase family 130 protein [bacterium]|nr:glycoside hydrolase family 130 protein [bacterium]